MHCLPVCPQDIDIHLVMEDMNYIHIPTFTIEKDESFDVKGWGTEDQLNMKFHPQVLKLNTEGIHTPCEGRSLSTRIPTGCLLFVES